MKKKKEKKLVKIESIKTGEFDCAVQIPAGATHVECEFNYDNCYYESDSPSVMMTFMKYED